MHYQIEFVKIKNIKVLFLSQKYIYIHKNSDGIHSERKYLYFSYLKLVVFTTFCFPITKHQFADEDLAFSLRIVSQVI